MLTRNDKIKQALAKIIVYSVKNSSSTQTEIAKKLGISQPRISSLVHGQYHKFSTDCLIDILDNLGYSVSVDVLIKHELSDILDISRISENKRYIKKVLAEIKEVL